MCACRLLSYSRIESSSIRSILITLQNGFGSIYSLFESDSKDFFQNGCSHEFRVVDFNFENMVYCFYFLSAVIGDLIVKTMVFWNIKQRLQQIWNERDEPLYKSLSLSHLECIFGQAIYYIYLHYSLRFHTHTICLLTQYNLIQFDAVACNNKGPCQHV